MFTLALGYLWRGVDTRKWATSNDRSLFIKAVVATFEIVTGLVPVLASVAGRVQAVCLRLVLGCGERLAEPAELKGLAGAAIAIDEEGTELTPDPRLFI